MTRYWTPEEEAILREVWQKEWKDIRSAFPYRSVPSIKQKARKLQLPNRPNRSKWTEDEERLFRRLWLRGAVTKEIAHDLGKSGAAIRRKRAQMGLPTRNKGNKTHSLRTAVSKVMYQGISRRAFQRRQTVSDYLRMLISRDLGHPDD